VRLASRSPRTSQAGVDDGATLIRWRLGRRLQISAYAPATVWETIHKSASRGVVAIIPCLASTTTAPNSRFTISSLHSGGAWLPARQASDWLVQCGFVKNSSRRAMKTLQRNALSPQRTVEGYVLAQQQFALRDRTSSGLRNSSVWTGPLGR
jgi:hypothetical protein